MVGEPSGSAATTRGMSFPTSQPRLQRLFTICVCVLVAGPSDRVKSDCASEVAALVDANSPLSGGVCAHGLAIELTSRQFGHAGVIAPRLAGARNPDVWIAAAGPYSRFQLQVKRMGAWEPTYEPECATDLSSWGRRRLSEDIALDWLQVPEVFTPTGFVVGPGVYRLQLVHATRESRGAGRGEPTCCIVVSPEFHLEGSTAFPASTDWTIPVSSELGGPAEEMQGERWLDAATAAAEKKHCPLGISLAFGGDLIGANDVAFFVSDAPDSRFSRTLFQRRVDEQTWIPQYRFRCRDVFEDGYREKHGGDTVQPTFDAVPSRIGRGSSYQLPGTYRRLLVLTTARPDGGALDSLQCCVLASPERSIDWEFPLSIPH